MDNLSTLLEASLPTPIVKQAFLAKGHIGSLYTLHTQKKAFVLKTSYTHPQYLALEAKMLQDLQAYGIDTPRVIVQHETMLLTEYISSVSHSTQTKELFAAQILAKLHHVSNDARMYGYYYNTPIAFMTQNNEQTQYSWAFFLAQLRILPLAKQCYEKNAISKKMLTQIETLCRNLYTYLDVANIYPSLIHGDLWRGNILFEKEHATLIDPALYFADKEMELAFIAMNHTFGETFFQAYHEQHPISATFYTSKIYIYQIYPLLLHELLYPSKYIEKLKRVLEKLKL